MKGHYLNKLCNRGNCLAWIIIYSLKLSKVRCLAAPVACWWAGAVVKKISKEFWQMHYCQTAKKSQDIGKIRQWMDQPSHGQTDKKQSGIQAIENKKR